MFPVAYTRTESANSPSHVSVSAVIEITSPVHEFTGPYLIRGRGPDSIDFGIQIGGELHGIPASSIGSNRYSIPMTTGTTPLGDEVKFYNTFDITWELSAETRDGIPIYVDGGQSHNRLYVTLSNPILRAGTTLLETVVHIGTTGAEGSSDEDAAILGVWAEFGTGSAPANVTTVGLPVGGHAADQPVSHALTYYNDYRTNNFTTAQLIEAHDGQCGSWARFFLDALGSQGIDQPNEYLTVYPSTPGEAFIVNRWDFSATPSGAGAYKWLNEVNGNILMGGWNLLFGAPHYNTYAWLPGAEVTDADGVAGQNNTNPASLFGNHQFVRLTVNNIVRYFDASYGVEYASLFDFDDNYLAGYLVADYDGVANRTKFAFRKNDIGVLEVAENATNY